MKDISRLRKRVDWDFSDQSIIDFSDAITESIIEPIKDLGVFEIGCCDKASQAPNLPGVYIMYNPGVPFYWVYVGISGNIRTRLTGPHKASDYPFYYVILQDEDDRDKAEKILIDALNPELNQMHASNYSQLSFELGRMVERRAMEYQELPY